MLNPEYCGRCGAGDAKWALQIVMGKIFISQMGCHMATWPIELAICEDCYREIRFAAICHRCDGYGYVSSLHGILHGRNETAFDCPDCHGVGWLEHPNNEPDLQTCLPGLTDMLYVDEART